jgi:hypothetical protein
MTTGAAIATAAIFVWLGMVAAISFLEAPLKFRAPGVTRPIGLAIGRLVFRALNSVEIVLAVIVTAAFAVDTPRIATVIAVAVAVLALLVQLVAIRPRLSRRSDAVLAGAGSSSRSRAHHGYLAAELVKVVALTVSGVLLLAT